MAGFLDTLLGTPEQTQALSLLAGNMMQGNTAGGLLSANQFLGEAPARRMKQQLLEAQIAETQAQGQDRALKLQREQEAMALAQRKQSALPGLFGGGEMPQSGAMPQGAPGAAPQFGQFNVQAAIKAGFTPKEIMEYAALRNANQDEVARVLTEQGPGGAKIEQQYDKFGRKVGAGVNGYVAPQLVNQGDRQTFVQPSPGLSVPMNMSFSDKNAAANLALSRQRLALDQANGAAGKAPAGYRFKPDGGLEFIPGGPADPDAAKRAAPTEFQGKSATYGARAQEADKIISGLDGKYSPAAVNSKLAAGNVPMIGGALEAGGNALLSPSGQKAEQAQRDFVNAVLRQESGAAISVGEFENARKQYFPQPFDSEAVKLQKARNRQTAIQGFLNNARPGAVKSVTAPSGATGSFGDDNDPLGLRK